jgi:hypothetical protein
MDIKAFVFVVAALTACLCLTVISFAIADHLFIADVQTCSQLLQCPVCEP